MDCSLAVNRTPGVGGWSWLERMFGGALGLLRVAPGSGFWSHEMKSWRILKTHEVGSVGCCSFAFWIRLIK